MDKQSVTSNIVLLLLGGWRKATMLPQLVL